LVHPVRRKNVPSRNQSKLLAVDGEPLVANHEPLTTALVRDHPFDFGKIAMAHQHRFSQMALALLGFRTENVTQIRLVALYFSSPSFLEALGGAFMCFQFRH
jgi:hypothetical protein